MACDDSRGCGAYPLVLLAGGRSSRLGFAKGLVPYRGRLWVEEQIARFVAAGGARAIVVVGFDAQAYAGALEAHVEGARDDPASVGGGRVDVRVNPAPERGPFSSLQVGLAACVEAEDARGAWVLPIDVPCASPETFAALAAKLEGPIDAVVPTHEGRGGHPVLLSSRFARHLLAVPADGDEARLDVQLRKVAAVARVAVLDDSVRKNLNTKQDWDALFEERRDAVSRVT